MRGRRESVCLRLTMFGGLGALSFLVNMGVTIGLVEIAGRPPRTAFAVGLVVVYLLNFCACRWGIFGSQQGPVVGQFVTFSLLSLGFRGLEYALFALMLGALHLPYPVVAALVLAGSFLIKFSTYDRLVFRQRTSSPR